MVLNSALCFLLIALALLAGRRSSAAGSSAQALLGVAVFLFSAAVFSQYLTGVDLGIDWAGSRGRPPADLFPGRIPGPSALGFMLCGLLLAGMHRVKTLSAGLAVQALTGLVVVDGLLGIAGHLIPLSLFYRDYVFGQTPLASACGFIIAGAALWWNWRRDPWYAKRQLIQREDQRIALIGVLTLAAAVSLAVLGSFIVMVKHAERQAGDSQLELLRSNITLFHFNIASGIDRVTLVTDRPVLRQDLSHVNNNGSDPAVLGRLRVSIAALASHGFSAIEVADPRGRVWAGEGSFVPDGGMVVPLALQYPARLQWADGFVLHTEVPIRFDGVVVATIRMEQRLTALDELLNFGHMTAQSGEVGICGRDREQFMCFPQRNNQQPYTVPYSAELPMGLALAGKTGMLTGLDYRRQNVVAAYGPIDALGLGMVVKVDTADLYLPLRQNLYTLMLLMLIIAFVAGVLLYRSAGPLVSRLEASERRLQTALEGSRISLWDWDVKSGTVYLSERWAEMLGQPAFPMTMQMEKLQAMVHPDDLPALLEHLQLVFKGEESSYDLEHRIRLPNGTWRWIRSRGKVAARNAAGRVLRMVGTNADITRRKDAEHQLAHQASHDTLTGLPNRLFFKDRLGQAMARVRRHKGLMAVMYLDIDKFKVINDTLGHAAGDALLKEFASRISSSIRATDTAVRLGGDEFVIILEGLGSRDDAGRVVDKIVAAMQPPFVLGIKAGRTLRITTSAGMAFYDGQSEPDGEALLRKADEALYEAKAAGRNNVKIAD